MSGYLWLKALHILSVIAWMAGLLYLPRLFVYHASAAVGAEPSETFKVMERRLFRAIMTPAAVASWIFGIWMLALNPAILESAWWMPLKLVLVIVLTGIHMLLWAHLRAFAENRNRKPAGYFRVLNEVPTLLMIVIVVLVVVQPF